MVEKKLLECEIKNKIRQLFKNKKVKITKLSVNLGYNKSFLSNIFHQEDKFFNLEHIEKICTALNYPIAKLFTDDVCSQEKQTIPKITQNQAEDDDPMKEALLKMFRGLSPKQRGILLGFAGELRLAEVMPPKASKKESAAQ